LTAHRQLAAEFGNQPDAVVKAARQRSQHIQKQTNPTRLAHEAVTFARDKNFEREAVVDERLLVRDALRRGMGEVRYTDVRNIIGRRLATGELVHLPGQAHQTARLFTTAKTIAAERDIVCRMREGQNQVPPVVSRRVAISAVDRYSQLNAGQRTV